MRYNAMLWVDPGLRSGWASWEAGREKNEFRCGITDPEETCDKVERWANAHAGTSSLIGSESFYFNEKTITVDKGSLNWPLELLGVCRYLAARNELAFDVQSPGAMKSFTYSNPEDPNEKLRRFGFYTPGPEAHARDASGHLLLALLTRGLRP